jgi:hypothetical protein
MLTAIAHNHDFGIDTMLVPGPPVRIHARIGGHRNGSRGKEGTRKRSAGRTRGGDKRRGGRERERRKKGRREKGTEEREYRDQERRADGAAGNHKDAIHHVEYPSHICHSASLPCPSTD